VAPASAGLIAILNFNQYRHLEKYSQLYLRNPGFKRDMPQQIPVLIKKVNNTSPGIGMCAFMIL